MQNDHRLKRFCLVRSGAVLLRPLARRAMFTLSVSARNLEKVNVHANGVAADCR